jgi:hypothetical protein
VFDEEDGRTALNRGLFTLFLLPCKYPGANRAITALSVQFGLEFGQGEFFGAVVMRYPIFQPLALVLTLVSLNAPAIETAPRISDREIIESLARLEAGQKALEQSVDLRLEAIEKEMDRRFAAVDQRFESLEKRIDDLFNVMLTMFSAMILLIISLFGYIIWDRRTALRPLEARLAQLEQDLERDLQLRHEQGSLPTRLLEVLRKLAREDEKLAGVLRGFSML